MSCTLSDVQRHSSSTYNTEYKDRNSFYGKTFMFVLKILANNFTVFTVYLTTLSVFQTIYRRMIKGLTDGELERMREEAVVA